MSPPPCPRCGAALGPPSAPGGRRCQACGTAAEELLGALLAEVQASQASLEASAKQREHLRLEQQLASARSDLRVSYALAALFSLFGLACAVLAGSMALTPGAARPYEVAAFGAFWFLMAGLFLAAGRQAQGRLEEARHKLR